MSADGTSPDRGPGNAPEWLEAYRGLTAEECRELAAKEHRPLRVIEPGSAVTADFVEKRLNVQVGQAGQVIDIYHG